MLAVHLAGDQRRLARVVPRVGIGIGAAVIRSRAELKAYQEADRLALGGPHGAKAWLLEDVWRYQRALRRLEYELNTRVNPPLRLVAKLHHRRLGRRLGLSVPPNVFGPGLSISHPGTIVVHSAAKVGANCRIHVDVTVGSVTIGDNCYIGAGARLLDAIELGSRTIVGANAVVNRSFPEGNVTLVGVPAKATAGSG
jgi:serine O-acetyltransferase